MKDEIGPAEECKNVSIRMLAKTVERADKIARENDCSRSDVFRWGLKKGMELLEKKQK